MSYKRKLAEYERNTALRLCVKSSPARSWRELDNVGEALLGRGERGASTTGLVSVQEALRIVAVWRIRHSSLPHAIESTASIAEILLKEDQYTEHELRLMLSAVIIRSVNGLADVLQQNRAAAASVVGLCATLGIPAWIVQLRHDATHQQLPPLPSLRMGATSLLAFFDSIFWTPLREKHREVYGSVMEKLRTFEKETKKLPQEEDLRKKIDLFQSTQDSDSSNSVGDGDPFGLNGSRLGSNKNQFALLQHKKRKVEASSIPKKKKKVMAVRLNQMALDIVNSSADHPDILFQTMLDFLADEAEGVMATSPQSYRFLLKAMGDNWPGFLPTLLVQCSNSPNEEVAMSTTKFLCSRSFVKMFDKAIECGEGHAPALVLLSQLKYPLNSICDHTKPGTTLHKLLVEIIGPERTSFYGIVPDDIEVQRGIASTKSQLPVLQHLSGGTSSPWKPCVKWEQCPLGSLPTEF